MKSHRFHSAAYSLGLRIESLEARRLLTAGPVPQVEDSQSSLDEDAPEWWGEDSTSYYSLGQLTSEQLHSGIVVDSDWTEYGSTVYYFTLKQAEAYQIGVIISGSGDTDQLRISLFDSDGTPLPASLRGDGTTLVALLPPGSYAYRVQFGDGLGTSPPFQLRISVIGGGNNPIPLTPALSLQVYGTSASSLTPSTSTSSTAGVFTDFASLNTNGTGGIRQVQTLGWSAAANERNTSLDDSVAEDIAFPSAPSFMSAYAIGAEWSASTGITGVMDDMYVGSQGHSNANESSSSGWQSNQSSRDGDLATLLAMAQAQQAERDYGLASVADELPAHDELAADMGDGPGIDAEALVTALKPRAVAADSQRQDEFGAKFPTPHEQVAADADAGFMRHWLPWSAASLAGIAAILRWSRRPKARAGAFAEGATLRLPLASTPESEPEMRRGR